MSNDRGQFNIPNLPRGAKVAIKAGHPQYAQEAISEVSVGESNLRITMDPGVFVNGNALSRDGKTPVTGASILFRSTQPPHDTVIATTDYQGAFMVRLKPGEYLYQAAGIGRLSPGWERLDITAAREVPPLRLTVAATGVVHGVVRDAVSGAPIQGARLEIESNGSKAALLRTGPTGAFRATIAEGESLIRLESAPGYLPPTDPATRFHVAGGAEMELPGMWLRPIPTYMLYVLDEDGDTPRPGAVITLLRPRQFGWRVADAMGLVEIRVANLPEDRRIIGMVEDPREPLGALFALHLDDVQGARVQLLRLGSVRGRVVNARGRGLEGLLVGGIFPGELIDHDLLLWQRLTEKDGHFSWDAIVPGAPQRCVAIASDNTSTESMILNPAPGEAQDVGNVVLRDGKSASSLAGKPLRWRDLPQVGGPPVDRRASENRPAMVVYCDEEQAEIVLEGLGVMSDILGNPNLQIALVINGHFAPQETPIPVFNGVPPNAATTFLLDASGRAVLETIGLPPLIALRKLHSETMP
ncbi:MAG TPA: carboxypeptidase regulatory-like domain-containing protein [Candidatus Hydrogenedentes bacterium]|nr:carboxypeptidase regulatory-like domain-containing protein [Candidatus Hydrogenedentota bacterium]